MLIRDKVEKVLSIDHKARNSDRRLILEVWKQSGFELSEEQEAKFFDLPQAESIRRTRQKLQEEGLYLADKQVKRERDRKAKQTSNEMVADRIFDDRTMKNMRRMF